ncbi:hypothetical protein [Lacisediminimonas sp.]|uniref:hypothetical protein n=1 Tax=Lacisediminimonas sp. TaxID=3060582 RepID=UPI00271DA9A3|nr:hypothetical protein [Lacisediminimonas sp.]MDO8298312.1 hypothetical protein [Lacisediminimonas sp.]MDO9216589.1 hypothetical protein [Lacisediminimonas sp.]
MSRPASTRYLVHAADPATLADVLDGIRSDPALELEDTIGPPHAPHTAVVRMNDAQAKALRHRFRAATRLSIEPDQPLSPFPGGGN